MLKSHVCINLFLDLADMYNHIKMVLTQKNWITPNLLCNNKWKNVLISQVFQIQNVISQFKWHFTFQSSTLFHVYLLSVLPVLVQIVHTCSLSVQKVGWCSICIFLSKTWWLLILMFTGTLVQINSTFQTLIIVKYIFYQHNHKDISWEKCNFWILLFSLNRTK